MEGPRMETAKRRNRKNDDLPVLLVLTAYVSRYLAGRCYDTCHPELGLALFLLRAFIYAGLFAAWGVSVHHRIVQKRVRMYMMTVAVLALFLGDYPYFEIPFCIRP